MREKKESGTRTKKVKTMALSVFLAVIVWFMVIYVNDPDITTTVSDLNVRFAGETALREKGFAITGRDDIPQLAVVVSGKRSDLMNFMDDIYVQVNVNDINATGEYNLEGAISIPTTRITVEKERYGDIPVTVEPLETKEIEVVTRQTGTHKDKVIKSEPVNKKITITGARSETKLVAGAVAEVDISEVEENGVQKIGYLLTDESGALIEKNETLESNRAFVEVENTIYEAKTMPVTAMLTAELDKSYILKTDKTVITPASLTVGVEEHVKDDKLVVYIDRLTEDGSGEYTISSSNGIYIPEENRRVKVKYEAGKRAVAQLELDVQVQNVAQGLSAQVDGRLIAQVWGEEGKISAGNVIATVDAKDLGAGEYNLPVTITGDNVGAQENYTVNVTIQ